MDSKNTCSKLHQLHTLVDDLVTQTEDTDLALLANGIHHFVAEVQSEIGETFDIEVENDPVKVSSALLFIANLLDKTKQEFEESAVRLERLEHTGGEAELAECFSYTHYVKASFDTVQWIYQQLRETENV